MTEKVKKLKIKVQWNSDSELWGIVPHEQKERR